MAKREKGQRNKGVAHLTKKKGKSQGNIINEDDTHVSISMTDMQPLGEAWAASPQSLWTKCQAT